MKVAIKEIVVMKCHQTAIVLFVLVYILGIMGFWTAYSSAGDAHIQKMAMSIYALSIICAMLYCIINMFMPRIKLWEFMSSMLFLFPMFFFLVMSAAMFFFRRPSEHSGLAHDIYIVMSNVFPILYISSVVVVSLRFTIKALESKKRLRRM